MTLLVPVHSPIVTKAVTTSQWPGRPAGSVQTPLPGSPGPRPAARAQLPRLAVPQRQGAERLHARLASLNIAGGAVCDALVAATAAERGITLATRDRRAAETYRAHDIDFQLID